MFQLHNVRIFLLHWLQAWLHRRVTRQQLCPEKTHNRFSFAIWNNQTHLSVSTSIWCGIVAWYAGQTSDLEVAGLIGKFTVTWNCCHKPFTWICLCSSSSINWYWPKVVMLWSWEGNRGPGKNLWQPTAGFMTNVIYWLVNQRPAPAHMVLEGLWEYLYLFVHMSVN